MKDGGPAFPYVVPHDWDGDTWEEQGGASLRDYFAAHALIGVIAHPAGKGGIWDVAASDAYEAADAMLAAREKGNE